MQLAEIIIQYIQQSYTDFAIMIDGVWGSGKTFFLKNHLKPEIEKIQNTEVKRNYQLVYISVYGVNSIDELRRRIFLSLHPDLSKRFFQITGNIIQKVGMFFSLNLDLKDIVSISGIPKNKVLAFDDLERLETETLNEILGVINSYTEHQNLKVIIVADETKLRKKLTSYETVKEKLVRFTYKYNSQLDDVFVNFLVGHKSEYSKFLENQKKFIIELFEYGEHKNLRSLKFVIDLFEGIFQIVKEAKLKDHEDAIIKNFLFSFLTYAIEYKKGKREDLDKLKNISQYSPVADEIIKSYLNSNEQQTEDSFEKDFKYMYIKNIDLEYNYYEFIAEYIHTGSLSKEEVRNEITKEYELIESRIKEPEAIALDKLKNIKKVNDEDIFPLYNEVLLYVKQGKYKYDEYLTIFYHIELLKKTGILHIDDDYDLLNAFKDGILITSKDTPYLDFLHDALHRHREKDNKTQLSELRDYILTINRAKQSEESNNHITTILNAYLNNKIDEFYDLVNSEQSNKIPIFVSSIISSSTFLEHFLQLNNSDKSTVVSTISKRFYRVNSFKTHYDYKAEIPFLEEVLRQIDSTITNGDKAKISTQNLLQLQFELQEYLNSLSESPE